MPDRKGRMERGGMSPAMGGPETARMPSLEAPRRPPREGQPEDVARSVREEVEAHGMNVGSEDFDAITGESPHLGPTAGGG
ncbi:MAG TPA: hypothetical protein V6D05_15630 [Stenomitos sp.]